MITSDSDALYRMFQFKEYDFYTTMVMRLARTTKRYTATMQDLILIWYRRKMQSEVVGIKFSLAIFYYEVKTNHDIFDIDAFQILSIMDDETCQSVYIRGMAYGVLT